MAETSQTEFVFALRLHQQLFFSLNNSPGACIRAKLHYIAFIRWCARQLLYPAVLDTAPAALVGCNLVPSSSHIPQLKTSRELERCDVALMHFFRYSQMRSQLRAQPSALQQACASQHRITRALAHARVCVPASVDVILSIQACFVRHGILAAAPCRSQSVPLSPVRARCSTATPLFADAVSASSAAVSTAASLCIPASDYTRISSRTRVCTRLS